MHALLKHSAVGPQPAEPIMRCGRSCDRVTWQPAFVAAPRRAGATTRAATRRTGARGAVSSGGRKKPASRVADAPLHGAKQPAPARGASRLAPGRTRAFSLKTRAVGLDMVVMAAGRLEARSARVDTPQTSHSRCRRAGRLEGSRGAPQNHAARSAARARELRCGALRGRCARCSAVVVHTAQGTRARGVSSGCAADARGA
jgi:hypothetical protein